MQEAPKSSWTYHPLNGQELLKWIFADSWQKLVGNGQFMAHLSYHNPSYLLKLEVQAFDASAKGATNEALAETFGELGTSGGPIEANRVKFDLIELETSPLKEPDKGRELIDEGRYKTVTKDGILVDEKVKKEVKK